MDLKIDDIDGDLTTVNGDLEMVEGQEVIQQFLKQKFKFFLAEWFLDENQGVPWFDSILVKNPNPVTIDTIFKDLILSTPGVIELVEYQTSFNRQQRRFRLTFKALTTENEEINFSEELPLGG